MEWVIIFAMLLRPAEPDDAIAVARVHVRSWQAAYRSLLPDAYLDQLRPEDRAARYNFSHVDPRQPWTIVSTDGGVIHGFATTAPTFDLTMAGYGELCALYVDPDYWGCGIGVALVSAARARLIEQEFQDALLWVLAGNVRADRFYRKDKWLPEGVQREDEIWGVKVNESRYRRKLSVA
jgi:GNAT superfamily N-acetyltransferase